MLIKNKALLELERNLHGRNNVHVTLLKIRLIETTSTLIIFNIMRRASIAAPPLRARAILIQPANKKRLNALTAPWILKTYLVSPKKAHFQTEYA